MAELTCEQKLTEARQAMHDLQTGKAVAQVRYGERTVVYTQADIAQLAAYIAQLEDECGSSTVAKRRPFRFVW